MLTEGSLLIRVLAYVARSAVVSLVPLDEIGDDDRLTIGSVVGVSAADGSLPIVL